MTALTAGEGRVRPGGLQAAASLVLAAAAAAIIAATAWDDAEVAGRLAIVSVVMFAIVLVFGSARLVGLVSVPMLGAALLGAASVDGRVWLRSAVVACLWYVAVELAWDSIERRLQDQRSRALDQRRAQEVATVVLASVAVTLLAFAGSELGPQRTILAQAAVIVALAAALTLAARHLTTTAED